MVAAHQLYSFVVLAVAAGYSVEGRNLKDSQHSGEELLRRPAEIHDGNDTSLKLNSTESAPYKHTEQAIDAERSAYAPYPSYPPYPPSPPHPDYAPFPALPPLNYAPYPALPPLNYAPYPDYAPIPDFEPYPALPPYTYAPQPWDAPDSFQPDDA